MSDMLLELVSTIHIIVVGIVADDDTRVLHHVLNEAEAWNLRIRKSLIGVGSTIDFHKFRFIGVNIHLFSRMLLDRRNNLAPQLIIFRKCSMIHRFNCSITSDDVHAEVLTIPLLCKVSKTIYGSNYVKEKMYLSVL